MKVRGGILRIGLIAGMAWAAAGTASAQWCWFRTVSGVAFGTYDVFSATPLDSTGTVSITCLLAGNATVALSTGISGSFLQRTMRSGSQTLAYNLFLDAQRQTVWGDGTGGSSIYGPVSIILGTRDLTIYGRVPARQDAGIGAYADTITVTINF
jgi:spore coat protein U-like protein